MGTGSRRRNPAATPAAATAAMHATATAATTGFIASLDRAGTGTGSRRLLEPAKVVLDPAPVALRDRRVLARWTSPHEREPDDEPKSHRAERQRPRQHVQAPPRGLEQHPLAVPVDEVRADLLVGLPRPDPRRDL